MPGPVERTHGGWRLRALYPLAGVVAPLGAVPTPVRRIVRRRVTEAAVRVNLSRCRDVRLVGVTGSMGKTTVKDLLGAMLATRGRTLVTRENDNGLYGVPATLLAVRPEDTFAVVEAGVERPGDMAWMAGLFVPRVVVLTSIASDHLAEFKSVDRIATEKGRLLERVPPHGAVVVNADDPKAMAMAERAGRRTITAGRSADAGVRVVSVRTNWPAGIELTLHVAGERMRVQTRLLGEHQATAVALALAAALELGVPAGTALAAVPTVPPRDGRLSLLAGPGGSTLLLDEHKSRPVTAVAALRTLRRIPATRRIAVLGECQDIDHDDAEALAPVARAAREAADLVVTIGRAGGALRALGVPAAMTGRPSEAVEALPDDLGAGDVILLNGAARQHLLRVGLRLNGAEPGCDVARCRLHWRCTSCPHLGPGPPERVVEAP